MTRPSPTSFPDAEQRRIDRERKREAVLLCAVRLFNERGFQAASLDEVATALGISKPTIYYYLGNKEQVLLSCLTRGIGLLRAAADEAAAVGGGGLDRLRRFLRRYAEINMDDFGRCVIRTGDEMLSPDGAARIRSLKREVDASLRALIEAAIADGSLAPVDVRLAAFTIAGALNWPARWYDPAGERSAAELAAAMVDMLIDGLGARRER